MSKDKDYGICEYKCGICGKVIITLCPTVYAYKLRKNKTTIFYCCYSHYRKAGGDNGKYKHEYSRNK